MREAHALTGVRVAFVDSSDWFCGLVESVEAHQWTMPALGVWDVRGLVGHTARAIMLVADGLRDPRPGENIGTSVEEYARNAAALLQDPAAIARRGVETAAQLGDDLASAVRQLHVRAKRAVENASGAAVVQLAFAVYRLDPYLETRAFELIVHGTDLARALGRTPDPPANGLAGALQCATQYALAHPIATQVALLRALSGRGSLADGFNVLG